MKRIEISPEVLVMIMKNEETWRVSKGVPKDAVMKGLTLDPYANTINIFIEHESFPEVHLGNAVPVLDTEFIRIR